jgi:hypothetical protein
MGFCVAFPAEKSDSKYFMTPAISLLSQSSETLFCGMLDQRNSARQAHNLKVVSSNLAPATNKTQLTQ